MNQGRIWCVVSPTVGLPLLLGSVALTSLAVHTAVLTNTTWYANSYQGSAKKVALNDAVAPGALAANTQPGFTVTVAPVAGTAGHGETSFVVTVAPKAGIALAAAPASHPVTLAQAK